MTQTPGASGIPAPPTPIVTTIIEYGMLWSASNGSIVTIDNIEVDGESTPVVIGWPTRGSFNSVNFGNDTNFIYDIVNQFVSATFVSRTKTTTTTPPGATGAEGATGPTTTITYGPPIPLPYTLVDFTVDSNHESNNKWIYPDDYNAIVDVNYPKQYGGVVLFAQNQPGDKEAGVFLDAGCDKDARYTFTDTSGNEQTVVSGYNYFECFEKGEYRYKPRNSVALSLLKDYDAKKIIIPSRPYYKDLTDEKGKHAPIYPIDIISSFNVDLDQQSVTVTYTFNFEISNDFGEEDPLIGLPPTLQNPTLTMTQTITQPDSVSERLQKLLDVSSYVNPDDYPVDSLAPGYTIDYPYTMVSGFDGIGTEPPTKRGTDIERYDSIVPQTLQRGDVWYNPANNQRKYWKGTDMVDNVKIVNRGSNYVTRKNIQVFATIDVSPEDTEDTEIRTPVPYGLYVDITADSNGQIVSASIVDDETGHNFINGDIVAVPGGNGNGRLEVEINDTNRWVNFYVARY